MPICMTCQRDIHAADSCTYEVWVLNDVVYAPIPYEDRHGAPETRPPARCADCGVARGRYHHFGCALEECPRCHRQVLTCDCLDALDAPGRAPAA